MPNGCAAVGVCRRAVKSMSLIATFQSSGPNATISDHDGEDDQAEHRELCRRKRRHASAPARRSPARRRERRASDS